MMEHGIAHYVHIKIHVWHFDVKCVIQEKEQQLGKLKKKKIRIGLSMIELLLKSGQRWNGAEFLCPAELAKIRQR